MSATLCSSNKPNEATRRSPCFLTPRMFCVSTLRVCVLSTLFVSHDLAAHAELVDRMAIMYAGKIVEINDVIEIFDNPAHPYTQRLIGSIPVLGGPRVRVETPLGQALDRLNWPSGCRFHTRCPHVMDRCRTVEPELTEITPGQFVACHLYTDAQKPEAAEMGATDD